MLTLPTKDLHTMRIRRTASNLAYFMLCALFAKTYFYFYIWIRLKGTKEEEPKLKEKEEVSGMHCGSDTNDVKVTKNSI